MKKYDYLIVGAGLFGSVIAYRLKQMGKTCLVIDKRPHVGGNIYCENVDGINVHKYGAHIFHTNNKQVWDFVNSFVPFNRYTNQPVANYKGRLYNLPFNMNTFYQMWGVTTPDEALQIIESQRYKGEVHNLEEQALSLVGTDIYERLIKDYTEKQWGRSCKELPSFIIRRLPLRFTFDNNYFNALYQGIPVGGYNRLIEALLDGIDVQLNCDFFDSSSTANQNHSASCIDFVELKFLHPALTVNCEPLTVNHLKDSWQSIASNLVYTGPIDQFYDYTFGHLQYRTVRFETETLPTNNYQGNAVVNYTDSATPFTRIIEHKHFEELVVAEREEPKTVISREYSTEWQPGMEPYYPVNDEANNSLYEKYAELAKAETNIIFGGRLAEYKYYDMDRIVELALSINL